MSESVRVVASCALHHLTIMHHFPRVEAFKIRLLNNGCWLYGVTEGFSQHDDAQRITPTPTCDED